jgi:hypothetical protein
MTEKERVAHLSTLVEHDPLAKSVVQELTLENTFFHDAFATMDQFMPSVIAR